MHSHVRSIALPPAMAAHAGRHGPLRTSVAATALAAVLVGCGAAPSGSGAPASGDAAGDPTGLGAAATGVCDTVAQLPDVAAAERTFTNEAHDALHALAAVEGLNSGIAAAVLVSMSRVHADFSGAAEQSLADDLHDLHTAADNALLALGTEVPACP